MTTAEMISAVPVVALRPPWAAKGSVNALGVRVDAGDIATAAEAIDKHAKLRGVVVAEICRVDAKFGLEAVFARIEKQ